MYFTFLFLNLYTSSTIGNNYYFRLWSVCMLLFSFWAIDTCIMKLRCDATFLLGNFQFSLWFCVIQKQDLSSKCICIVLFFCSLTPRSVFWFWWKWTNFRVWRKDARRETFESKIWLQKVGFFIFIILLCFSHCVFC